MHGLDPARGPRPLLRLLLALAIVALGAAPVASAAPKAKTSYDYYVTGNPADAASSQPPRSPSTLLMGGGTDVDAAFRWMIDKSGGGDFVVIRATGADGYNQYIYEMGGVDSVESLVIPTLEATNHPFVSKFSTDRLLRGPSEKKLFPGDALHADHRTTRCLLKFDRTRSIVRIQILIPVRPCRPQRRPRLPGPRPRARRGCA
jgi:hypothetical protein